MTVNLECFRKLCGPTLLYLLTYLLTLSTNDTVGWVICPLKPVPDMTYNVFGGTLSLTQSIMSTNERGPACGLLRKLRPGCGMNLESSVQLCSSSCRMTSLGDGGRHNGRRLRLRLRATTNAAPASDDQETVDQAYIPTASLARVGACPARRVLITVTVVVVGLPASYPHLPRPAHPGADRIVHIDSRLAGVRTAESPRVPCRSCAVDSRRPGVGARARRQARLPSIVLIA